MRPYPVRLPESLIDDLDEEANERDLGTAEYIRKILRRRDSTQEDTQEYTQPNTQEHTAVDELEQRLAEVEARLSELEAEQPRHAHASASADAPDDQRDASQQESLSAASSASQHTPDAGGDERVERGVVVKADSVRAEAEQRIDDMDIPGSGAVQRNRRQALLWAWDYLRQHGKRQSGEIANATFGAFWDVDLNYSTSSRSPAGRTLWQNCLREPLKRLPQVDPAANRGGTWEFVDGDSDD